ncbi:MAG: hypothetical protein ACOC4M_17975, partial [Promethearchaeia archaeon]
GSSHKLQKDGIYELRRITPSAYPFGDLSEASEISEGFHSDLSVGEDDVTYFKIEVQEQQNLSVNVKFPNNDDDNRRLYFYTEDEQCIGKETALSERYTRTNYTGYYYIEILNRDTATSFNLTAEIGEWQNDEEFSGPGTYEGYSLAQDEANWFKVTNIPNDNNLSVTLIFDEPNDCMFIELYDEIMVGRDSTDAYDDSEIAVSMRTQYKGTYFFVIENWGGPLVELDILIETLPYHSDKIPGYNMASLIACLGIISMLMTTHRSFKD